MKLTDLPAKPPKIIIYGDVGVGKTGLIETLGERLQLLDFDDGARTGLKIEDALKPERLKVDVRSYLETDPTKRAIAFKQAKDYIYGLPTSIEAKTYPFKALAVDSLTAFADSAVAYVMGNSGALGKAPEIQHWGVAFMEIKNVLSVLRSLPIVVLLVAHEQVKEIGDEKKLQIAVAGQKLPNEICRFFDEIWYMKARSVGGGKKQYTIQTIGDNVRVARSRASVADNLDTSCGMVELLRKTGYDIDRKEDLKPK